MSAHPRTPARPLQRTRRQQFKAWLLHELAIRGETFANSKTPNYEDLQAAVKRCLIPARGRR